MNDYVYELKIPRERIAVLIGTNGKVKNELELLTKTIIRVDSNEGDVFISGNDPLGLYNTREIVQAIGRGFNPEVAKLLLKPDYCFELVNLSEHSRTANDLKRLRGRVIGTDGKCRRLIEELADVNLSVYGKTICIIGEATRVVVARKAIYSLLQGSPHSKVYQALERERGKISSL
jgi:ribosomal RNA assembly protein